MASHKIWPTHVNRKNHPVGPKRGQKVRNFSVLDEEDCNTAWLSAYWVPFGRQGRAWPHGAEPPLHFHMHIGKSANFSKHGFSLEPKFD